MNVQVAVNVPEDVGEGQGGLSCGLEGASFI
jgi:hypothetical protein